MPVFCNHLDVSIHGWMVLASETRVFVSFRYKYDKYVSIKMCILFLPLGNDYKQHSDDTQTIWIFTLNWGLEV